MSKKHLTSCSDCRHQQSGFDGGFFGSPFTCECALFGVTENRKNCRKFEKKITRNSLFDKIYHLEKENEQLRKQVKILKKEVRDLLHLCDVCDIQSHLSDECEEVLNDE